MPVIAADINLASIGDTVSSFFDAAHEFFSHLAAINWVTLILGMAAFAGCLVVRSRALFNSLRAAYPIERFQWRRVWGAYIAAYGINNFVPGAGGNVVQLYLTKRSIPHSRYPTVAAALSVTAILDSIVSACVLAFAFTQGVFPKPPDFSKLNAFDLAFLAAHPRFTLFLITALLVLAAVAFAWLSARVKAFWARVRQGLVILSDRRRYLREVVLPQALGWLLRFAAFWFMLEAFHIGGSLRNVLLVQAVAVISAMVPITPSGAGVQQALLVTIFASAASGSVVAAYSVGQQIALAATTTLLAFAALALIFHIGSFREILREARRAQSAEGAAAKT
ncbi:MAG: hypothetical protein QOK04_984 [Solirubrobacteraceae bacterium]|nr:hypothetical protein [Solirubrobacteraceae bacterium]